MARKVIIDCDMGIDDAVALCLCLFDERLDVVAVTACEGSVTVDQANQNLQAIIGLIDPDKYPRLGCAQPADNAPPINTSFLYGEDGLGNSGFEVSRLQHLHSSDKLMADCIRANPNDVTVVCLGPLTNLARAFQRDKELENLVDRVVIAGGSINGIGNITAAAEFNMYFDPTSARQIFFSRTTKTLIPLDVTRQVSFGLDFLEQLPGDETRAGSFLRQILPHCFRTYRRHYGHESITLNDVVSAMCVLEPQLFEFGEYAADVETAGEITRGVTVFDRREPPESHFNMEVAIDVNAESVWQYVVDQLTLAGNAT
jgi:inosine-uridine nucleoside N-ribohydrolase